MAIRRLGFLTLAWLCLHVQPVQADAAETFNYRVYYQGLLSAMARVAIADVRLDIETPADSRLLVSTLSLSSEAYGLMDALYPIRYRLRALYSLEAGQLYAYERYKRTRKIKHDLVWVDERSGLAHWLLAANQGGAYLPDELRPWFAAKALRSPEQGGLAVPHGVLDRLTLLQALREQTPRQGQELVLPVTDGKQGFTYRITGEGRESLAIAGQPRDSWRLRIEGFTHQRNAAGEMERDHDPVYVWLSADERRIPLRFHADHDVGGFAVEWVPEAVEVNVVVTDQPLTQSTGSPAADEG
jgi:hypothetical protein